MSPYTGAGGGGVGDVLGGRYELTERIAAGGMGDVWAARDDVLGRTVAVKVMRPRADDEGAFAERFRDEARHTAGLTHPNIAAVYDYGEDEGTAYLVMELVPGEPLSSIIARGPVDPERARSILGQCALALAAAHEAGVVHRDVKPANILVTPEGRVKLTDFGIARAGDSVGHTRTGEVMGTPQYLATEQAMGKPVTGATDLYSLGVVGFETLTGQRPFDRGAPVPTALAHINDDPPPLPPEIGEPLRSAIETCLLKDPADRPASAAALAALLGMPVAGVATAAPATSIIPVTDLPTTHPGAPPTQVVGPPGSTAVLPQGYAAGPPGVAGPAPGHPAPGHPAPGYPAPGHPGPAEPRRRSAGVWWLVPVLVALLVGGFLLWQSVGRGANPAPTSPTGPATRTTAPATTATTTMTTSTMTTSTMTTSTMTTSTPTTAQPRRVTLRERDYTGQTVGIVRADLTTLGFTNIDTREVDSAEPAGTVIGVSPTGNVPVTESILLTVSNGKGKDDGGGNNGGGNNGGGNTGNSGNGNSGHHNSGSSSSGDNNSGSGSTGRGMATTGADGG